MRKTYHSPDDFPEILPVFPLSGSLLLPRIILPLNIFEPRYLQMIDDVLTGERLIGIVQPEQTKTRHPDGKPILNRVACAGRLTAYSETDDGRLLITLTGLSRFKIKYEIDAITPYRQVAADFHIYESDLVECHSMKQASRKRLLTLVRDFLEAHSLKADWESIHESSDEELVNSLSMISPFNPQEKQALLEAQTLDQRADILIACAEIVLAKSLGEETPLQ